MTWKYRYRKQIMIGIMISVLLAPLTIYAMTRTENSNTSSSNILLEETDKDEEIEKEKPRTIKIDIKGQVMNPGLFELAYGKRVSDAIAAAGGLTENADVSVINLSMRLRDEMVIIIHSAYEVRHFKRTIEREKQAIDYCRKPNNNGLQNDACIGSNNSTPGNTNETTGLVNINTASIEELMKLSGIGETRARDIIAFREQNGPFSSIEEIKKVRGIGEGVFANIQESITT